MLRHVHGPVTGSAAAVENSFWRMYGGEDESIVEDLGEHRVHKLQSRDFPLLWSVSTHHGGETPRPFVRPSVGTTSSIGAKYMPLVTAYLWNVRPDKSIVSAKDSSRGAVPSLQGLLVWCTVSSGGRCF